MFPLSFGPVSRLDLSGLASGVWSKGPTLARSPSERLKVLLEMRSFRVRTRTSWAVFWFVCFLGEGKILGLNFEAGHVNVARGATIHLAGWNPPGRVPRFISGRTQKNPFGRKVSEMRDFDESTYLCWMDETLKGRNHLPAAGFVLRACGICAPPRTAASTRLPAP